MSQGRLQNRVAIITGGARGIGRAIAFKMVKEGASVMLLDLFSDEPRMTWEVPAGCGFAVIRREPFYSRDPL